MYPRDTLTLVRSSRPSLAWEDNRLVIVTQRLDVFLQQPTKGQDGMIASGSLAAGMHPLRDLSVGERLCYSSPRLAMQIPGKRISRVRWIQADRYVVAVEVEMVIPSDDPSEPCYEAETVQLLHDVEEHARRGDVDRLKQHGKVYEAVGAP
jgi:hypothetical protein